MESWRLTTISGEASILDARFEPPPPWPDVSEFAAHVRVGNTEVLIDPLHFEVDSTPIQLRGRLTTSPPVFELTLTPQKGAIELEGRPDNGSALSSIRVLGEGRSEGLPRLQQAFVRGTVWPPSISLTITAEEPGQLSSFQTTCFFRSGAVETSPLLLRTVRPEGGAGLERADTERGLAPRGALSR